VRRLCARSGVASTVSSGEITPVPVNLTLENIDPDAMDIELISECLVVAAAVLAPDENFDIVIANDFVSAVRFRTSDERERESYGADRTFGEAAARALANLNPPTIIVHAGFVVRGADRNAALETFEHETLHVLTARRESLNDVRLRRQVPGVARGSFVAMAGVAGEAFRVVRALALSREQLAADFSASLVTSLDAFSDVIRSASDARTFGGGVESYCEDVMTAFSNLVTMLAYLATAEPVEFESEAPLWDDWVAPTWPQLHALLHRLPPASERADPATLDEVVFELAELLRDLLADIGFALEDNRSRVRSRLVRSGLDRAAPTMTLATKPLDDVDRDDLQALVDSEVAEGCTVEFKQSVGSADKDKREFLADVSSFANSTGGDLLIGVGEKAGVAAVLVRLVAKMLGQLRRQRPLHQPLGQLREHPAGPDDLFLRAGTGEQLVDHLVRETVANHVRDLERPAAGRALRSPSGLAPHPAGAIDQLVKLGLGLRRHDPPFRSCLHSGSDTPSGTVRSSSVKLTGRWRCGRR
jgi:hypothetical protein